jgi:hypothetical protein
LFVGEIGLQRREFLYEIKFWEARRIIRGYRKRGKIFMQLLAENVYASTFAFRGSEGKTVKDMFPSLFKDDMDMEPGITEEEQNELQALIEAENARIEAERKSSEE